MTREIEVKLGGHCGFRLHCTVCGGTTEKFEALAEAEFDGQTVRVCRQCLKAGADQINARLRRHIFVRQNEIAFLESLVGRLQVPTFEQWQAHDEFLEAEYEGCSVEEVHTRRERFAKEFAEGEARRANMTEEGRQRHDDDVFGALFFINKAGPVFHEWLKEIPEPIKKAFDEGWKTFENGGSTADNPYPDNIIPIIPSEGSPHRAWNVGFAGAKAEKNSPATDEIEPF
jgi:hypothetical protein